MPSKSCAVGTARVHVVWIEAPGTGGVPQIGFGDQPRPAVLVPTGHERANRVLATSRVRAREWGGSGSRVLPCRPLGAASGLVAGHADPWLAPPDPALR